MEYIIKMKDECVNDKATNTSTINKTLFSTTNKNDVEEVMRNITFSISKSANNLPFLQFMEIMPVYVTTPIDPITGVSTIDVYYNKNNVRRHRRIYVETKSNLDTLNKLDHIIENEKYNKIYEK